MFKICYLGDEKCFFSNTSNFAIWNRKTHKIDTLNPPIVTKFEMLRVKCFLWLPCKFHDFTLLGSTLNEFFKIKYPIFWNSIVSWHFLKGTWQRHPKCLKSYGKKVLYKCQIDMNSLSKKIWPYYTNCVGNNTVKIPL